METNCEGLVYLVAFVVCVTTAEPCWTSKWTSNFCDNPCVGLDVRKASLIVAITGMEAWRKNKCMKCVYVEYWQSPGGADNPVRVSVSIEQPFIEISTAKMALGKTYVFRVVAELGTESWIERYISFTTSFKVPSKEEWQWYPETPCVENQIPAYFNANGTCVRNSPEIEREGKRDVGLPLFFEWL